MFSYFTIEQITPLIISGIILISSVISFKKNSRLGLSLLFIGTIVLGYFIANLDPFLKLWDEQYHALVAKNLSNDFLKPTLYKNPVLDFSYKNWTANHIWLHKQPLFLWQIALSIKLFGTTEFAVRLPSIIMHAIIPLFIYRIGKISIGKETGYYGALLFAVAYFPLELVSGRFTTDHNDVAFLFYVTASFWAWFEYTRSGKKYWLILIGLFSGSAVLVKWLMGLLVYVIWAINVAVTKSTIKTKIQSFLSILLSGIVSLSIFLPWQIFIHLTYPNEATYEMKLNSNHFFNPIEDHIESTWYYFTDGLNMIYGSGALIPFMLLLGVVLLIYNIPNKRHKIFIASGIIFVYIFYTLASTKMVSFMVIVSPFIYLGLAYLIYSVLSLIEKKIKIKYFNQILSIILPVFIAFTALNLMKIQNIHTMRGPHNNDNRIGKQVEMKFIRSINKKLKGEDYVIFNASITVNGNIPIMFYTDYTAYNFIPNKLQIEKLKKANRKIAVIDIGNIPDYIINDDDIKILDVEGKELLAPKITISN
jgi:4-amino-4-deoxy-L-arabinose transferase